MASAWIYFVADVKFGHHTEKTSFATAQERATDRYAKRFGGFEHHKGWHLNKSGAYCVQLSVNKKKMHIGSYKTQAEAEEAYRLACASYRTERYTVGYLKGRVLKDSVPEPMSGCWLWIGHRDKGGYGTLGIGNGMYKAHRISYEAFKRPPDSLTVRHRCDNRACVNPDHLELGSDKDNVRDCFERKRRGRLDAEKVRQIRQAEGLHVEIGERFGISANHVSEIKRRRRWGYVA